MTEPKRCPVQLEKGQCVMPLPENRRGHSGGCLVWDDTEPRRCETCGSLYPSQKLWFEDAGWDCPDAFHDAPKRCETCGGTKDEPLVITEGDLRFRCVDWFHPSTWDGLHGTPASEPPPDHEERCDECKKVRLPPDEVDHAWLRHGVSACICPTPSGDTAGQKTELSRPSPETPTGAASKDEPVRRFTVMLQKEHAPHPTTIPWSVAELAYSVYATKYGGAGQSLERVNQRGGFAPSELDMFLPNWRQLAKAAECNKRVAEAVALARNEAMVCVCGLWLAEPTERQATLEHDEGCPAAAVRAGDDHE